MHDDFLTSAWADHHQHIGTAFDKVAVMFRTAVTRVRAPRKPRHAEPAGEKAPDVQVATV